MIELGYQVLADADVAVYHHKLDVHDVMNTIAQHEEAQKRDEAFAVVNLSYLYDRFQEWKTKLPRFQAYYAIKSNNDRVMTKFLADMGCNFDCASKQEMNEAIFEGLVEPDRVIYANPVKHRNYIKHAERLGIRKMTFDNEEELMKVKQFHRNPEMVLRIRVDDPTAGTVLGVKFGCDPPVEKGTELLKKAKEIGVPIVGVAFHVGTMCHDPSAYREGLCDARKLFDIGTELGHKMRIVDIGGGFPGQELPGKATFDQMVAVIVPAAKEFFPEKEYPDLELTAEPGRFFSTEPVCVVVHVIGATKVPASRITKKEEDKNKVGYMYYVNDGVYGSFNTVVFNDRLPVGLALQTPGGTENGLTANYEKKNEEETFPSIVWGPTCDGIDKIEENIQMPKLTIEDWIYYPHMGAYSTVAASKFNGFDAPRPYYIIGSNAWESIYGKDQEANQ